MTRPSRATLATLLALGACELEVAPPVYSCGGGFSCMPSGDETPTRTDLFPTDDGRDEGFLSQVPTPGTIEAWADGDPEFWGGGDLATVTTTDTFDERCQELGHRACFGFRYDEVRNSIVWEAPEGWAADPPTVFAHYELLAAWRD